MFDESHSDESESRPTINLFEQWEEGAHMSKLVNARDYSFPKSLVVPFSWMYAPKALTLSDAVNYVSQHEERDAWGQASKIKLVPGTNYPNQPERNPSSHLSDPLTYWWGVTLCPPELNDASLAESVVILMQCAVVKEINLNTEVQKPSLAEVLEFQGSRMECADESTPHQETRIYSSILEGGNVMQQFEEDDLMELQAAGAQHNVSYPVRAEGNYVVPMIPWPRIPEKEERDNAGVQKRKPYVYRRQGNRWDQYGITSDQMNSESTWGPCEPASRDKRPAQPYRLQKANKSDGQWSRWASDIRQSQPDQWSSSSSRWHSSAGDERSWNAVSEWEDQSGLHMKTPPARK